MNNDNNEIVTQLKSIKKWAIVSASGLLLIGLSAVIFTVSMVQMTANFENDYFADECSGDAHAFSRKDVSELIKQDKLNDALALVDARLETHPNDAYAHWYKARIHVLKEEWELAQKHVEKMEAIAASWEEGYIAPLRQKIEKLSEYREPG